VLDAALRILSLDARRHADQENEALALLGGIAGQPQPTMRLTSLTLH
jgi:hypothetical protein